MTQQVDTYLLDNVALQVGHTLIWMNDFWYVLRVSFMLLIDLKLLTNFLTFCLVKQVVGSATADLGSIPGSGKV